MKQRKETLVPREELPVWAQFQASLSEHPIIRDEYGMFRYQLNPLTSWLLDHVDLNEMCRLYQLGLWSRDVFMQFYRDIGYSLSGFEDVWGEELEEMDNEHKAEALAQEGADNDRKDPTAD